MGINHRKNGLQDPTLTAAEREARKRPTMAEALAQLEADVAKGRRELLIALHEIGNLKRQAR